MRQPSSAFLPSLLAGSPPRYCPALLWYRWRMLTHPQWVWVSADVYSGPTLYAPSTFRVTRTPLALRISLHLTHSSRILRSHAHSVETLRTPARSTQQRTHTTAHLTRPARPYRRHPMMRPRVSNVPEKFTSCIGCGHRSCPPVITESLRELSCWLVSHHQPRGVGPTTGISRAGGSPR